MEEWNRSCVIACGYTGASTKDPFVNSICTRFEYTFARRALEAKEGSKLVSLAGYHEGWDCLWRLSLIV